MSAVILPFVRKDSDRAARVYHQYSMLQNHVAKELILRIPFAWIPDDPLVLDLGCGTGVLSQHLKELPLIQIDYSLEMLKQSLRNGAVIGGDMHRLPIRTASVDMVVSSMALHWTKLGVASAEIMRVLKPGGICVVAYPIEGTLCELKDVLTLHGFAHKLHRFPTQKEMHSFHAMGEMVSEEIQEIRWGYTSALNLLHHLRGVGGQNKSASRSVALSKNDLRQIVADYERVYRSGTEFYATWKIAFGVYRRDAH